MKEGAIIAVVFGLGSCAVIASGATFFGGEGGGVSQPTSGEQPQLSDDKLRVNAANYGYRNCQSVGPNSNYVYDINRIDPNLEMIEFVVFHSDGTYDPVARRFIEDGKFNTGPNPALICPSLGQRNDVSPSNSRALFQQDQRRAHNGYRMKMSRAKGSSSF